MAILKSPIVLRKDSFLKITINAFMVIQLMKATLNNAYVPHLGADPIRAMIKGGRNFRVVRFFFLFS